MTKYTLFDLQKLEWKKAVVVFKEESFDKPFTKKERSYEIYHSSKYFQGGKISNELIGNCLDGIDKGVRLDWYLGEWKVDYCYITEV